MIYWDLKHLALCGLILFCCALSYEQTGKLYEERKIVRDAIGNAALQTMHNWESAIAAGVEKAADLHESDIPRQYWTESIKALNPARVYQYDKGIAVVLHIKDSTESGWYIPAAFFQKPFLGIQTKEGFTFTSRDSGHGYAFERKREIQDRTPLMKKAPFTNEHATAALLTLQNFELAFSTGEAVKPEGVLFEIPMKYWPDSLRSLNIIRIYQHYLNVAVVLREDNDVEEGLYFLDVRSYVVPFIGTRTEDGFSFTRNPEGGTRFQRIKSR
jgi:hypothetical protein